MLATATSGDASRGRRAAKMPSGTPSATATSVEPATSSTCWPNRLASSARCAIQNASSDLSVIASAAAGRGMAGTASSSRRTRGSVRAATTAAGDRTRSAGRRRARRRDRPSANASPMSCVTMMTVLRSRAWMRRNSACSSARVSGSSAPNGSSISSIGGSTASARATPTRCRWPPDSSSGQRLANVCARQPDQLEQLVARAPRTRSALQPSRRGTTATLSATVICGKRPTSCST